MERILVVDDEESARNMISQVLTDDGHEVVTASSGEAALEIFKNSPFPIVMTDVLMQKMSGIDLLHEIKALNPNTQVVIITSNASLESAMAALRSGAYDYLTRPFEDLDTISSVIKRAAEKVELIRQNQTMVDHLENLASRDALTGLFNRRYFLKALELEFSRSQREGRVFSLLFIDLDHFKHYNDTLGHPAGDELLKELAALITKNCRATTLVARYGGEEFVLLAPETPKDGARIFAERLRKQVEKHPFQGRESQPSGRVTMSIGVSTHPEDGSDCETLISRADEAMYQAKADGRNRTVCR